MLPWLEEQVVTKGFTPPPFLTKHSANPPAHERMQRAIDSIQRFAEETQRDASKPRKSRVSPVGPRRPHRVTESNESVIAQTEE